MIPQSLHSNRTDFEVIMWTFPPYLPVKEMKGDKSIEWTVGKISWYASCQKGNRNFGIRTQRTHGPKLEDWSSRATHFIMISLKQERFKAWRELRASITLGSSPLETGKRHSARAPWHDSGNSTSQTPWSNTPNWYGRLEYLPLWNPSRTVLSRLMSLTTHILLTLFHLKYNLWKYKLITFRYSRFLRWCCFTSYADLLELWSLDFQTDMEVHPAVLSNADGTINALFWQLVIYLTGWSRPTHLQRVWFRETKRVRWKAEEQEMARLRGTMAAGL